MNQRYGAEFPAYRVASFVPFEKAEIEQSIPARFERIEAQYPGRLALKTEDDTLTYGALNRAANRVARAIVDRRGAGEEPVAMLLEHGAPAIVGILGILKAGKFYVPLDATLPPSRMTYILEDSQAELILTNDHNLPQASSLVAGEQAGQVSHVLNMDDEDDDLSIDNVDLPIRPEAIAYVQYTSGTTGQPKGVVQTHRNLLHTTYGITNRCKVGIDDRLLLITSLSHAVSTVPMFCALLNGAAVFSFDVRTRGLSPLADWLIREEITFLHAMATTFRHWAATLTGEQSFPALRLVRVGGETAYRTDVELYKEHFAPDCLFQNGMGSAETGVICSYLVDKETPIAGSVVPVGYPVGETEILLLDEDGSPVGFDEVGEIAIRSAYLSPGYWRRPDLTRAKFLPDPDDEKKQIYLTGDLGRMQPDGCLEHLGRKDHQVKVRGFRVELAAVEAALQDLELIRQAAVVTQEPENGDKRIVAYVVPAKQPAPSVSALRRALAEKLPDYMMPSAFVFLDNLPLLVSGKVDRQGLPAPDGARPELETPYAPPRNPTEQTLAAIWAGVLGLEKVGIQDPFLDLGGHSLQATQIISRAVDAFRVELPLAILFESPTVAEMAAIITERQARAEADAQLEQLVAELEELPDEEVQRLISEAGQ